MAFGEFQLSIKEVKTETPDTKTLCFKKPVALQFEPGQFFTLEIPVPLQPKPVNRSYSTSSSPLDKTLDFTIKEIPAGECSPILCNSKPGDQYKVKGPLGKFTLKDKETKDLVFIGGGSGVTPFRGILRYVFAKKLPLKTYLLYSARTPDQLIFYKEFEAMAKEHKNFKLHLTCTRLEPSDKWKGGRGRITLETIKNFTGGLKGKVFYLCGGKELVESFEQELAQAGVPKEDIKKERFY